MSERSSNGLTVGEVARRTGLAPSAVRYYERCGLLPRAERVSGWRRFPEDVVERIELIRIAAASGFRLAEVAVLLEGVDDGQRGTEALATLARSKLPELEAALARAQVLVRIMRAASECQCPSLDACMALAREELRSYA